MEHVSGTLEGLGFVLFSKGDWGWVIEPRVKQASHPEQVVIGQHMIGRLGAEFLSLKWLIENAVQLSARAPHDPDHDVTLDG
jgi:hypothetical protein